MLDMSSIALGCPVEIEFAVNIHNNPDIKDEFCLLQIKPMVIGGLERSKHLITNNEIDRICKSNVVLGDGTIDNIFNILYIHPDSFDRALTSNITNEIEILNRQLGKNNPYLLIGPGRWGTADPWLGIPVNWKQISYAKVIVELGLEELNPEPSFGSHFFQNVTSLRIGYFTVQKQDDEVNIDLDWLDAQSVKQSTKYIRWIELDDPLLIHIDGSTGEGHIMESQLPTKELMNEEDSTGI
jgi:hypothetical protein